MDHGETGQMNELEDMFGILRDERMPDALSSINGAVLAGVAAGQQRLAVRRGLLTGCGVAIIVGLFGAYSQQPSVFDLGRNDRDALLTIPDAAPSRILKV